MIKTVLSPFRTLLGTKMHYLCSFAKTVNNPNPRGKLLVVPTPIGNLGDLSPNILKALYTADLIGC